MMRSVARRRKGGLVRRSAAVVGAVTPDVVADVAVLPSCALSEADWPTEAVKTSSDYATDPGIPERNRFVPGQPGGPTVIDREDATHTDIA
jgi:hypothetical protein